MFLIAEQCGSASTRCGTIVLCECAKLHITEMYVLWVIACYTRNKCEQGIGGLRRNSQGL
jgi:hypothetical protein